MKRSLLLLLLLLLMPFLPLSSVCADYVFVGGFESIDSLYVNSTPHTIVVVDGQIVVDATHQRQIPILIRYPQELIDIPGRRLPLVLWSHGGGPNADGRLGSREWSESLVRAGYIVVHMSHLARTDTETAELYAEFGLTPEEGTNCFNTLQVDRPRDARAVLDALPILASSTPALTDRIDIDRIAIAGHSFGAYTVRALGGALVDLCPPPATAPAGFAHHQQNFRDERPRAFLALSPQGPDRFGFFESPGTHSWLGLDRPDFSATGTGDFTPGEQPVDRVRPFQVMAPNDKFMLYIDSAEAIHATFNLENPAQPQMVALIRSTGIAFLDAQMLGDARAAEWLFAPAAEQLSFGVASLSRR